MSNDHPSMVKRTAEEGCLGFLHLPHPQYVLWEPDKRFAAESIGFFARSYTALAIGFIFTVYVSGGYNHNM